MMGVNLKKSWFFILVLVLVAVFLFFSLSDKNVYFSPGNESTYLSKINFYLNGEKVDVDNPKLYFDNGKFYYDFSVTPSYDGIQKMEIRADLNEETLGLSPEYIDKISKVSISVDGVELPAENIDKGFYYSNENYLIFSIYGNSSVENKVSISGELTREGTYAGIEEV